MPKRRTGAIGRFLLLTALSSALIVLGAAVGRSVLVQPQIDELRKADAIVILGGPTFERYPYGIGLAEQGWAPELAISNPHGGLDPWLTNFCEAAHAKYTTHCFTPDPLTTRGEARELARMADKHGWRSVIVVTFLPHVSRARYIVQKCFDATVIMAASPSRISAAQWVYQYVYQTAGFIRAALTPGC